jgi:hypothetical protein
MSDPRSDLDDIREQMSVRRTELRVVDNDASRGTDDDAAAVLSEAEEALAAARAWVKARTQAFVTTDAATQLSLAEFLR